MSIKIRGGNSHEKTRLKMTEHQEQFGIFLGDKYVHLMNLIHICEELPSNWSVS